MQRYVGTKLVKSIPMTLAAYNELRGWTLPEDEDGNRAGYLVEYENGGEPNVVGYEGYISWSPKEVFEGSYTLAEGMPLGAAIEAMREGCRVRQPGMPGFVVMMPGLKLPPHSTQTPGAKVNDRTAKYIGEDTPLDCQPYFAMYDCVAQEWHPGWLPSTADCLATNWEIMPLTNEETA